MESFPIVIPVVKTQVNAVENSTQISIAATKNQSMADICGYHPWAIYFIHDL
jgi:hypothetical protein